MQIRRLEKYECSEIKGGSYELYVKHVIDIRAIILELAVDDMGFRIIKNEIKTQRYVFV